MRKSTLPQNPTHKRYDVVIVGGAMMGAATAWFLAKHPDFDGRILVVERDPSYADCSTARTNSCIRQQFSTEINIRISQFAAAYIKNFRAEIEDPEAPTLSIQDFGYMYLATTQTGADALRANHAVQVAAGAGTRLLTPEAIARAYPFYHTDDLVLGSHNPVDEGYWDGITVFDAWRRGARRRGVEFVANTVVALQRKGARVVSATLANGSEIALGQIVNATGPRAAATAAMAGLTVPVEPRKRFTWVFRAAAPLPGRLPLTVDPAGIHVRQDGAETYMAGGFARPDGPTAPDDLEMDHTLWQDRIWPALAHRIPAFEAIRVEQEWAGHYAYNTFDQNAVVGPHPEVGNFHFLNGFSGHGLQQAPAMGRGMAEWLTGGCYQTLDLSPFHYDRILAARPLVERAVI